MSNCNIICGRIDTLEEKIDAVSENIASIDKTLAVNTSSLQEHMRRTELNEKAIEVLKEDLKPISKHVHAVNVILKVAASLGGAAATIYYTIEVIRYLNS